LPSAEGVAESNISSTRQQNDTRQRFALPSACLQALGKPAFAECHAGSTRHTASRVRCVRSPCPLPVTAVIVCRVPARGHSANTSLPSATQLALGKHYHVTRPLNVTVIVCRVPGCGTRQRFINSECNYNGTRRSLNLCRVPSIWHSTKFSTRPVRPSRSPVHLSVRPVATFLPSAAWHTAKVCRVPEKRHSAKPVSPVEEMPCALRRVLHSANNLPSVFRQSTRVR